MNHHAPFLGSVFEIQFNLGGLLPLRLNYLVIKVAWWWKKATCNAGDVGSIPGSERSPGGKKRQPILVFLPEKSHRQRSLVDCSLWCCKTVRHGLVTEQ